jgi:hypothetical protein
MVDSTKDLLLPSETQQRPIPPVIFTGTNLEYVRAMLEEHGKYIQDRSGTPIHFTDNPVIAFDVAINRAYKYKATPILLVVNSQHIGVSARWSTRIGFQDDIWADEIPPEAVIAAYELEFLKRTDLIFADDKIEELKKLFKSVDINPTSSK